MVIDRKNSLWIIGTFALFAAATVVYIPYSHRLNMPSGGSAIGLAYGIAGSAMMLFALLLSARKKAPTLRIGSAYWWMKAHVWLGLLAYPVILYHAGFQFGGAMTQIIMWLFTAIVASGIFGIIMQNIVPRRMFEDVPLETIYEQASHVVAQVRTDADGIVARLVELERTEEAFEVEAVASGAGGGSAVVAAAAAADPAVQTLKEFYVQQIRPFLYDEAGSDGKLSTALKASNVFDQMRKMLPLPLHEPLDALHRAVEERRQIARQKRLHLWMHGWLLIHLPLSFALLVLSAAHAVFALRYTSIKW